ncbi:MAG: BLUF domain-containing protein [Casimicrobium sp.]
MIRLTYISTCSPGLKLADVRAILKIAQRANQARDITGMLYWSGEFFMQTLEGSRGMVTGCFDRVFHDPRHREVELVSVTPTHQRWFTDWSMGFTELLASHRVALKGGGYRDDTFNPYLLEMRDLDRALADLTQNSQRMSV